MHPLQAPLADGDRQDARRTDQARQSMVRPQLHQGQGAEDGSELHGEHGASLTSNHEPTLCLLELDHDGFEHVSMFRQEVPGLVFPAEGFVSKLVILPLTGNDGNQLEKPRSEPERPQKDPEVEDNE